MHCVYHHHFAHNDAAPCQPYFRPLRALILSSHAALKWFQHFRAAAAEQFEFQQFEFIDAKCGEGEQAGSVYSDCADLGGAGTVCSDRQTGPPEHESRMLQLHCTVSITGSVSELILWIAIAIFSPRGVLPSSRKGRANATRRAVGKAVASKHLAVSE